MKPWPLLLLALGALAFPQDGNAPLTVIRAGRIYPVSGPPIDHGLVVIRDGKILDVRAGGEIPRGATLVEADNEVVIPGLVDAQTSVAEAGRDAEESIAPDVRTAPHARLAMNGASGAIFGTCDEDPTCMHATICNSEAAAMTGSQ